MSDWASERVQKWREALWAEKGLLAAAAASDFDVASLLRSIRAEAIEEAAEKLMYQSRAAMECAKTYDKDDPGQPRQSLQSEASHFRQGAEAVRALLDYGIAALAKEQGRGR